MISDKTIAVLPFVNMSVEDANEYFSDGITEEIINALAKIEGLKVTSRTSSFYFKNKDIPLKDIGAQLNVATILEGSVRLSQGTIRITAQLINAQKDYHFWSETWDRKLVDIFAIQDEISLEIADKLREQMGHIYINEHLVSKQTEILDAYTFLLKAKAEYNKWNPESMRNAISLFEAAIQIDPKHAESYAGLSDAYGFMATTGFMPYEETWAKAVALTKKAASLNSNLPDVSYQLGNLAFFVDCDYKKAVHYFNLALKSNHNYPEARQFLAYMYTISGNLELAKKHIEISLSIDPLSQETKFFNAYFQYSIGNYAMALTILDECIDLNPKNIPAHSIKCQCLLILERFDEVIAYFDSVNQEIVIEHDKRGLTALALIKKNPQDGDKILREYFPNQNDSEDGFFKEAHYFLALVSLGRTELALDWIEQALEHKFALGLIYFSIPLIDSIKDNPRYVNLRAEIFRTPISGRKVVQKKPLLSEQETLRYSDLLIRHIGDNKPFLESTLTLRTLAAQIEIHPNQLSWLLNETFGKSYNDFINEYRVNSFKNLAQESNNNALSILGMAYESGFNSKTVFNTFFKKHTGTTPKLYLDNLKDKAN